TDAWVADQLPAGETGVPPVVRVAKHSLPGVALYHAEERGGTAGEHRTGPGRRTDLTVDQRRILVHGRERNEGRPTGHSTVTVERSQSGTVRLSRPAEPSSQRPI